MAYRSTVNYFLSETINRIRHPLFPSYTTNDYSSPQLTIGIIKGLNIPKPSIDEQKAIASAVSSATKKLQLATKKLALLESTKKALMQDLLTGKVRVKLQKDMLKNVE